MNESIIQPASGYYLVKPIRTQGNVGGLELAEEATDHPIKGEVLAVGDDIITDYGNIIGPEVEVGDTILFREYGPHLLKVAGNEYQFVSFKDYLGKIANKEV